MNTRQLISSTALYGIGDVAVLAMGGFLLLPLYTRTLSQPEFGTYVVVRTNIEILTYLLFLGLPSAMARVYFDYKKDQQHVEYVSSVLTFFLINLAVCSLAAWAWGPQLWALLSPGTPANPYLGFSLAIAATGFFGAVGTMWLRIEGRVVDFTLFQLGTSAVLAAAAVFNLMALGLQLQGLLIAQLVASCCSGLSLVWLLGRRFRPVIRWKHVAASLQFALPVVVGYVAYFVLNRVSTLMLQHHVGIDKIAVYGLAQQLAMIVTVAATAFGKALQPAVYAAGPAQAAELMARSSRLMMVLMFCVTSMLLLFASDIFSFVAPRSYESGHELLLILLLANFAYSFTLISDTALLYHRRPKTSVGISIAAAALCAVLGAWLIPDHQLHGAAWAMGGAFFAMALMGQQAAYRLTGSSYLTPMLLFLTAAAALAAFAAWLHQQRLDTLTLFGLKSAIVGFLLAAIYVIHIKTPLSKPCAA